MTKKCLACGSPDPGYVMTANPDEPTKVTQIGSGYIATSIVGQLPLCERCVEVFIKDGSVEIQGEVV